MLDQFSFSFDMLKKELYDQDKTEEENIGFVKLVMSNLLAFNTEKVAELRKMMSEIFQVSICETSIVGTQRAI